MVGTVLLACVACASLPFILGGCGKKSETNAIQEGIIDLDDSKKEIEKNEQEQDEGPVNGAAVFCTSNLDRKDKVYILDDSGNMVMLNNLSKLSKKNIKMSREFNYCQYSDHNKCIVNREIEGNEWQDYDELNSMGTGKEGLNKNSSYMVCLTGCGVIYFADSGQKVKTFAGKYAMLNRYVNEEIFIGLGWNLNNFYSEYGNDAIETLKDMMYKYNITNEISICMFLATLGAESGNGSLLTEDDNIAADASYSKNVRGAGLIQVTGNDQEEFLRYLLNTLPEGHAEKILIEEMIGKFSSPNGKTKNTKNVTDYIANNYPIESATWYWGEYKKAVYYNDPKNDNIGSRMPLNDYITKIGAEQLNYTYLTPDIRDDNLGNLFITTQYYVNGSPWHTQRLQQMAECTDDSQYVIHNNQMTFTIPAGEPKAGTHTGRLPNGWTERKADWDYLHKEIFG